MPAQSLILMNDPFVIQQAEVMADKLLSNAGLTMDDRFQWIYTRAFSRKATEEELIQAKAFVFRLAKLHNVSDKDVEKARVVWKDYCHSVFNSKEFIYLI